MLLMINPALLVLDLDFQYPRTDRVECYIQTMTPWRTPRAFQYPRTDRVECYRTNSNRLRYLYTSFSILGRIVWNATTRFL